MASRSSTVSGLIILLPRTVTRCAPESIPREKRDENIEDVKGRCGFSVRDPPINCVTHNLLPGRAHELVPSRVCTVGMVGITRRARAHKQARGGRCPGAVVRGCICTPYPSGNVGPRSNSRPAFAYNRRCIRSRARSGRVHIHPPPPPPLLSLPPLFPS